VLFEISFSMKTFRIAKLAVCFSALAWLAVAGGPLLAQTPVESTLQVPLFPEFDLYGNQFEVVQAYENGLGQQSITAGIYDTGASVVAFSWLDQDILFDLQGQPPIPTIPGAVATADAIGGFIEGKVSTAGRIYAAGASALDINFDTFEVNYDLTNAVSVGGIQAFVGTSVGSPMLPSIVGTPINVPSATNSGGLATVLDQSGYTIDLSSLDPAFNGIEFEFPDVRFVSPGTSLVPTANTYEAVNIPVSLFGDNNIPSPGNNISAAPNPFQNNTAVAFTPSAPGSPANTLANQSFLFDTGAQISIISPAIAVQLGLIDIDGNPIETPFDTIDVQGAGETPIAGLPGYILDSLTLPRTDGGVVEFTNVPVYVLDVGLGIDGILGMNLFNAADSFLYDPYNLNGAQVSVLFLSDRTLESVTAEAGIFGDLSNPDLTDANSILSQLGLRYALATPLLPGLQQVPEPSTLVLGLIGLIGLIGTALRLRSTRRVRGSE
jgi:Aspartyl protease/PEP-CTERM motif